MREYSIRKVQNKHYTFRNRIRKKPFRSLLYSRMQSYTLRDIEHNFE
ncbi:hypothetical protein LEP1GSC185_3384 [Leptospira licerasiae serovar Varillal str. VAR 010]|nr:hypothetical protein LEP1GSC185_3384 [Leptospira licerasiae serovar Varillal str. VAR 010]